MKKLIYILILLIPLACGKEETKKPDQNTPSNLPQNYHPINFIAMGDWGRDGQFNQKETGDQMGIYAANNKCDFVISLGDNFYDKGVESVNDPKWKTSFESIYTAASLQVPWYIVLGNHDYGGNVQAQIDYTKTSKRWNLPARYYSFEKKVEESISVLFIMMDSNPFIESYKKGEKSNAELNDNSINELRQQDTQQQLRWLDSTLSVSTAIWKIVCAHHPIYSGGIHGSTQELIDKVKPILEKYKVTMYVCGHDHDIQYLQEKEGGINYFVAGSGSELRPTTKIQFTKYVINSNGFLAVTITNNFIKARFIDQNGKELFTTDIK
jgi:acid phosphatase